MLAILFSVGIPLVFLYFIWSLEIFSVSRISAMLAAFGWGLFAFTTALVLQTGLLQNGFTLESIAQYVAPVLEELLKAGMILLLLQQMRLRYPVDGAAYGFAIGTAFAICENLLYVTRITGTAVGGGLIALSTETAIARAFSVSLMHAFCTALVGAVAGTVYTHRTVGRLRSISLALIGAMGAHAVFNTIALNAQGPVLILLGFAFGLGGTALIIVLINRSLRRERAAIDRALSSSVSAGERAASLDQHALTRAIEAARDDLGAERVAVITEYVRLLAQRGMLRRTADENQRARYAQTLTYTLSEIETRLAGLRQQMGLYTSVWLRGVLPSEESGMWQALGAETAHAQPIMALIHTLNVRQAAIAPEELARRQALLARTPLFEGLADEELHDLALLVHAERRALGEAVVTRGARDERLFIVAEGSLVAALVGDDGQETIVSGYGPDDVFGELSMIDGQAQPATITCVDAVLVYTLTRDDLLTLVYAKPQIGVTLMKKLVAQIRQQMDLLIWVQHTSSPAQAADAQPERPFDPLRGRVRGGLARDGAPRNGAPRDGIAERFSVVMDEDDAEVQPHYTRTGGLPRLRPSASPGE
jgi:RsiW-degrading membrane proteinase PrsW (M82 family)